MGSGVQGIRFAPPCLMQVVWGNGPSGDGNKLRRLDLDAVWLPGQVPWSVNVVALAFISEVVQDEAYMNETWEMTPVWRAQTVRELAKYFPHWQVVPPHLPMVPLPSLTHGRARTPNRSRLHCAIGARCAAVFQPRLF